MIFKSVIGFICVRMARGGGGGVAQKKDTHTYTQIQMEECGKLLLTFSGYEDFMVNGFFNEIVKSASLHLNFFSFSSNSQFCLGYIYYIYTFYF